MIESIGYIRNKKYRHLVSFQSQFAIVRIHRSITNSKLSLREQWEHKYFRRLILVSIGMI